jgi:hypothetical protein
MLNSDSTGQEKYRDSTIHYVIERPGETALWTARGYVQFYIRQTLCSVYLASTVKKFTTEEEAKQAFLANAKGWIDRRLALGRDPT